MIVWFFLLFHKLLKLRHKIMYFRFVCLWFQVLVYFDYMKNQLLHLFVLYFIKKKFEILIVWIVFFLLMELFFYGALDYHVQNFQLWHYFILLLTDFFIKTIQILLQFLNLILKELNLCFFFKLLHLYFCIFKIFIYLLKLRFKHIC